MTKTDNNDVQKELREIHEDVKVIAERKPEMMPVLLGVIKGIRLSSEAAGKNAIA